MDERESEGEEEEEKEEDQSFSSALMKLNAEKSRLLFWDGDEEEEPKTEKELETFYSFITDPEQNFSITPEVDASTLGWDLQTFSPIRPIPTKLHHHQPAK